MNTQQTLLSYFHTMREALGPSAWWPADSPFEIALGAILTQNTAWTNVEKALENLRAHDLLQPEALWLLPEETLATLIRPAGFFRVKAKRIRNFLCMLHKNYQLSLASMADEELPLLRTVLLKVSGIGPETADSILLYALEKPSFVVDAYTYRIFNRHQLIPEDICYEELRTFFMDALPEDTALFNEFHALLVRTAKTWCAKKAGKCALCPLQSTLE